MRLFTILFIAVLTTNLVWGQLGSSSPSSVDRTARLAQTSNGFSYSFSSVQKPFQSLSGAEDLTGGLVWSEAKLAIPLGFNFTLFENSTDTLFLDTFFDDQVVGFRRDKEPIGPLLVFFTGQIIDRAMVNAGLKGFEGSQSPILLKTIGLPGNQITIVEFRNMGFRNDIKDNQSSSDFVSFQILIAEKTGDIEFIMGPSKISDAKAYFDGAQGPAIGLIPEFDFVDGRILNKALWFEGFPRIPSVVVSDSIVSFWDTLSEGQTFQIIRQDFSTESENFLSPQLKIFPNPSASHVHLKFGNPTEAKVTLIDTRGRNLFVRRIQTNGQIDLSQFDSGTYVLKVEVNGYPTFFKKIMHL